MFINALFFTTYYIEQNIYKSQQQMINNAFKYQLKSFYSALILYVAAKLLYYFIDYDYIIMDYYEEDENYKKVVRKAYRNNYRNRVVILIIIVSVFSVMFWYFLSIFGNVYPYSQLSLMFSVFISLFLYFALCLVVSFICAFMRRTSINSKSL